MELGEDDGELRLEHGGHEELHGTQTLLDVSGNLLCDRYMKIIDKDGDIGIQ